MDKYEMNTHDLLCSIITGTSASIDIVSDSVSNLLADIITPGVGINVSLTERHNDTFGYVGTALAGVTQYTPKEIRTTDIVVPHIAVGDVMSYNIQLPHSKKLNSTLDSFHFHVMPVGTTTVTGSTLWTWYWGWFKVGDTIPATLPNSGTTVSVINIGDQYKHLVWPIITGMTYAGDETYSSFMLFRVARTSSTVYSGDIALLGADVHYITDRIGSKTEYSD